MPKQKERFAEITGYGYQQPSTTVAFGTETRYRLENAAEILDLMEGAAVQALDRAGISAQDLDCIVCAAATPLQPIPCNAALVHERLRARFAMKSWCVPALDIGTTCTSFLTALDIVSELIENGRYERVLIVSGDCASAALNPKQKESYALFSDAGTAVVLEKTQQGHQSKILYAKQNTWSEGAHDTEIRGGGALLSAHHLTEENVQDYCFDMRGLQVLRLAIKVLPDLAAQGLCETGVAKSDIDMVIPHQASKALKVIMPKVGFPDEKYIDLVPDYGNMVSSSIPFALCKGIEDGRIHKGDTLLLIGTAAGLTANMVLLRY